MTESKTLSLTTSEVALLLEMAFQYADSLEFVVDPDAQRRAFDSWWLVSRLRELADES